MDSAQGFLPLHEQMHTGIVNRFRDLTDEQMRLRPHPQVNSMAWLLWHMARSEDMGPNAAWLEPLYVGKSKWWLLLQLALRHPSGHLGQATLIRKLQGLGSGGR
jgi:hypothetical protein